MTDEIGERVIVVLARYARGTYIARHGEIQATSEIGEREAVIACAARVFGCAKGDVFVTHSAALDEWFASAGHAKMVRTAD